MKLEDEFNEVSENYLEDNKEFIKCDYKLCETKGIYRRCYFDIYLFCDNYKPYLD